jgi:hypothetical protein
VKLVDRALSEQLVVVINESRRVNELTAQGKNDDLDDCLRTIAKAVDAARVRLAQVESGL